MIILNSEAFLIYPALKFPKSPVNTVGLLFSKKHVISIAMRFASRLLSCHLAKRKNISILILYYVNIDQVNDTSILGSEKSGKFF